MDIETLKSHIEYDPKSGVIIRKTRKNSNGSLDKDGYLIMKIKGKQYKSHRLAWMYVYGSFPKGKIDHINGDKLDNRISNLRDVSQAENCRNATIRKNIETGYKGVYIDRTNGLKKMFAVNIQGKTHRFYSAIEASQFREKKLKGLNYGKRHF